MKDVKSKELINKNIFIIVLLLFVSNIYFYSEFKELKNNVNYMNRFSSAISIASNSNDMSFLLSQLAPHDLENLTNKFEEIKSKVGTEFNIKNYVAIQYKNGNTLIVKPTESKDGKYLIEDIFLLDESIYEKIKEDTGYGN